MIKDATQKDLFKIAACHVLAFPKSVTSLLGKSVVASMFNWYLSGHNKFLFYIEQEGNVVGYCGGHIIDGTDAWGSSSGMTQFGMASAYGAFLRKPWLLFHPEIRKRYGFIVTNIKRKFSNQQKPKTKDTNSTHSQINAKLPLRAGLVVIGVLPKYQGKGIGSELQVAFEAKAKQMHAKQLILSVRIENSSAIASYKRNGYQIDRTEGISHIMIKNI